MSAINEERPITQSVAERPSVQLGKGRKVPIRHIGIRFLAGALTSVASGALTLALGARVGGILLAFPAILAASLTLIAHEDDTAEAREDARGAVIGAGALAVFAAVAALALGSMPGVLALLLATAAWILAAGAGYVVAVWLR